MANLYKKALIKRDPDTGKRTPYKTEKWWGRYRDAHGVTKRIALSENKNIAQRMLTEIVQKVELEKSGLIPIADKEVKRHIDAHLKDFESHLRAKNNTETHVSKTIQRVNLMVSRCGWRRITDIKSSCVEGFLTDLRNNENRSISTSNHYLRAIKMFVNWLVATDRLIKSPLKILKTLNEKVDPRHQRRPLSDEEFQRLIEAAEHGGPACGLSSADRAMLYIIAAWTGFRRGEIGSLTLRSFDILTDEATRFPTVRILAAYSKRRRHDVQVLHPDLVDYFLNWVVNKRFRGAVSETDIKAAFTKIQNNRNLSAEILFPLTAKTADRERRTADMIRHDLDAARKKWIAEAETEDEQSEREQSDFLCYCNSKGKYADFHGLRHTFISNLGKAGVSPKTAQVLARHSTIELTMQVYTHIDEAAQVEAIHALPGLRKR